jgi:SNF2 family DNA or RNA helicase
LANLPRAGLWLDPGLGKTVVSITLALYKAMVHNAEHILIIVPPVLLTGWARFLNQIREKEFGPLDVLVYRGTPAQRKAMNLKSDIILVGIQIFKRDYDRFVDDLAKTRTVVIVDEAHCLKSTGSDNHKKVRNFILTQQAILLTGTPINSPLDAYGMVRLVAPGAYRSLHHFENLHIAERDFFGNVTRWQNLQLLKENLERNAIRLTKEECVKDLPPVTYTPLFYDLDPEHLRLYRRLAEQRLLAFEQGGKLDATSIQALFHALGQIVCNWGHFAQDESKIAVGFQLVEEVLDELGDGKLVLFSNYKLTNRLALKLFQKYRPVAIFGDVTSAAERDQAIDTFVTDPRCRLFIGNPQSAGFGIDRLQTVCSNAMFLEAPNSASAFTQALSRVHRIGQYQPVTVRLATAVDTLQVRQFKALLDKEELMQALTHGYQSVKEALGLK